jgi:ABC-type cobalamin/Fe3+-siderophores transport system ATPase subunit
LKRKCKPLISSKDGKRAIYLNEENKDEIMAYLLQDERHEKKFKFISDIILGNHRNTEVYDKEEINSKSKNVTAMKFFKGQDNDRIYCKEIHSAEGTFIVVAAILYKKKKTKKLNQQQINIIEKVAKYQYEI